VRTQIAVVAPNKVAKSLIRLYSASGFCERIGAAPRILPGRTSGSNVTTFNHFISAATFEMAFFLLRDISDDELQDLSKCLWRWNLCGDCTGKSTCLNTRCPWSRAERLHTFWDRYRTLTAAYVPEMYTSRPALSSHADLRDVIHLIQNRPHDTREQLMEAHFTRGITSNTDLPGTSDQARAMNLGASILFSVNCGISHEHIALLEDGSSSIPWRNAVSAKVFVEEAFPKDQHSFIRSEKKYPDWPEVAAALSVKQLRRVLGIDLEATTDLRSHLSFDRKRRILQVFHCTAMLKETLSEIERDPDGCLLPRELILEVFDTIHNVLFPPDRDSQALLSSLVTKHGFDKDLLRFEALSHRDQEDPKPSFPYFGSRLAELYDEMQNPRPRTRLESWFERKSGARYMLMATMIGVFIAVIIGILGLGVSGFQAYISYQQWKHPNA